MAANGIFSVSIAFPDRIMETFDMEIPLSPAGRSFHAGLPGRGLFSLHHPAFSALCCFHGSTPFLWIEWCSFYVPLPVVVQAVSPSFPVCPMAAYYRSEIIDTIRKGLKKGSDGRTAFRKTNGLPGIGVCPTASAEILPPVTPGLRPAVRQAVRHRRGREASKG